MLVQSAIPIKEVCAHLCDTLCPHQIRASFFTLLREVYTVTALKVRLALSILRERRLFTEGRG